MSNDADARRRQAIAKLSSAIMIITHLVGEPELSDYYKERLSEVLESLTRSRYLLVEHEEPDGILDELAQL
jgi:hypothetical protein